MQHHPNTDVQESHRKGIPLWFNDWVVQSPRYLERHSSVVCGDDCDGESICGDPSWSGQSTFKRRSKGGGAEGADCDTQLFLPSIR
jgi:hypothetical protein